MVLDCLTLNLNDTILIAASLDEQNPWISEIWKEIINYLTILFKEFFPEELIINEIWQQQISKNIPINFSEIKAEIFPNKEFTAFKCRFVLNLIRLIQIILKRNGLMQECIKKIFELLENFMEISNRFNQDSINRYVIWKKGYFSQKDCLPSLYIFEKNVLLAKLFDFQGSFNKGSKKLINFTIEIFKLFLQKLNELENAQKIFFDKDEIIFKENNYNEEYKSKNYEEKQGSLINIFHLLNENIIPFWANLKIEEIDFGDQLNQLIDVIIRFLPVSNVSGFIKFKCIKCVNCEECKGFSQKVKESVLIEDLLKRLILVKRK